MSKVFVDTVDIVVGYDYFKIRKIRVYGQTPGSGPQKSWTIDTAMAKVAIDTGLGTSSSTSRIGWGGPCPPSGTHRYAFTLTALPAPLRLPRSTGLAAVQRGAAGATLGETSLVGTYRR